MSKNPSDKFFDDIDFPNIVDNIKGIYNSDGSMSTLIDFERVLDDSDLYAYKNWILGEVVNGPDIRRYDVSCVLMYPYKLMPDPRGAKRLLSVGCNIKFKKTKIKVPVEIKNSDDFNPGTHYPKMVERDIWLVRIEMPKQLMDEIREGSIDLAGQTIDLDELDDAYDEDLDKESEQGQEDQNQQETGNEQQAGSNSQMPPPMAPGGQPQ
jgi:hypothetical protein